MFEKYTNDDFMCYRRIMLKVSGAAMKGLNTANILCVLER